MDCCREDVYEVANTIIDLFPSEVGATFQSKGTIQFGMDRHDFDHDGQTDLILTTSQLRCLKGSLWKSLKKGFTGGGDCRRALSCIGW
jgi:hypothetical protein